MSKTEQELSARDILRQQVAETVADVFTREEPDPDKIRAACDVIRDAILAGQGKCHIDGIAALAMSRHVGNNSLAQVILFMTSKGNIVTGKNLTLYAANSGKTLLEME